MYAAGYAHAPQLPADRGVCRFGTLRCEVPHLAVQRSGRRQLHPLPTQVLLREQTASARHGILLQLRGRLMAERHLGLTHALFGLQRRAQQLARLRAPVELAGPIADDPLRLRFVSHRQTQVLTVALRQTLACAVVLS